MESRRLRCDRNVAHVGRMRNANILPVNLKGRDNLEDIDVDGRIILDRIS
jgi:hypothetical protein